MLIVLTSLYNKWHNETANNQTSSFTKYFNGSWIFVFVFFLFPHEQESPWSCQLSTICRVILEQESWQSLPNKGTLSPSRYSIFCSVWFRKSWWGIGHRSALCVYWGRACTVAHRRVLLFGRGGEVTLNSWSKKCQVFLACLETKLNMAVLIQMEVV